jgi:hypothetical protein
VHQIAEKEPGKDESLCCEVTLVSAMASPELNREGTWSQGGVEAPSFLHSASRVCLVASWYPGTVWASRAQGLSLVPTFSFQFSPSFLAPFGAQAPCQAQGRKAWTQPVSQTDHFSVHG